MPDSVIRLRAVPDGTSPPRFTAGCGQHDGTSSCDLGPVAVHSPHSLQAQLTLPAWAPGIMPVTLFAIASAPGLPRPATASASVAITAPPSPTASQQSTAQGTATATGPTATQSSTATNSPAAKTHSSVPTSSPTSAGNPAPTSSPTPTASKGSAGSKTSAASQPASQGAGNAGAPPPAPPQAPPAPPQAPPPPAQAPAVPPPAPAAATAPLPAANVPSVPAAGQAQQPGGNAASLFPTLNPALHTGNPAQPVGHSPGGTAPSTRQVADTSALPGGAPVVDAQLAGLAALAAAFVLAVTRLSFRRRSHQEAAKPPTDDGTGA